MRLGPRCEPQLAEPVAESRPIDRHRRPGDDAVQQLVVGLLAREAGAAHRLPSARIGASSSRRSQRPAAARTPPLTRSRRSRRAGRGRVASVAVAAAIAAAAVGGLAAKVVERVAQRLAARTGPAAVAGRRPTRPRPAGLGRPDAALSRPPRRRGRSAGSGRRCGDRRDERPERGGAPASRRATRAARAQQERASTSCDERQRRQLESIGAIEARRRDAPARSDRAPPEHVTRRCPRRDHGQRRGGCVSASTRGQSRAADVDRCDAAAVDAARPPPDGTGRRAPIRRPARIAIPEPRRPAGPGAVSSRPPPGAPPDARRRQRPATRPTMDAATVAVPRSTQKKARGPSLTRPC